MQNNENLSISTGENNVANPEIKRLKDKFNLLLDEYKKLTKITELEQGKFVLSLIGFFFYINEKNLAMTPTTNTKNAEKYIYIPVKEFHDYMFQKWPNYSKKQLINRIRILRVIDEEQQKSVTVYNKTRVLKINRDFYCFLTEGSAAND